MPYIKANDGRRKALQEGDTALTAGELNYQIYYYVKHNAKDAYSGFGKDVIVGFIRQFLGEKPNYQKYNDMTGCLVRCYTELKRRMSLKVETLLDVMLSFNEEINAYEDIKRKENGDVE